MNTSTSGSDGSVRMDGSRGQLRVVPLDMDVIDTSWMDSNVHAMRHNFFNVRRRAPPRRASAALPPLLSSTMAKAMGKDDICMHRLALARLIGGWWMTCARLSTRSSERATAQAA